MQAIARLFNVDGQEIPQGEDGLCVWHDCEPDEPTPEPTEPTEHLGSDSRPAIDANDPDQYRANDRAIEALAVEENLFHRGGSLARLVREHRARAEQARDRIRRDIGAPRILPVEHPTLREILSRAVQWFKVRRGRGSQDDRVLRAAPPDWCVSAVACRGSWPSLRYLDGIVEAPTIRPDGTILDQPGYDDQTGLLYEPTEDFPPLPPNPTRDDARRAYDVLLDLVQDFPFPDLTHASVWVAALLTVLGRPAICGPTPLFLFDAAAAGSGKTLLAIMVGLIALGRDPSASELSDDNEEMRKTITTIAIEGERLILFDNASEKFGCKSLDAALTASSWKGRILGASRMTGDLPLQTVWLASGNNLELRGDTHRRVIPCRLEPDCERPEERSGFRYPDILGHIRGHRGELVVAGLTILLAYQRAGRPKADLPHFGSYESWSDTIRQAIHWAVGIDPCRTREGIAQESRGDIGMLARVFAGWAELPGGDRKPGITCATAIGELSKPYSNVVPYKTLREAICEWAKEGPLPSVRQLGNRFRAAKGRVAGGWKLSSAEDRTGLLSWYVERRV